MSFFSELDFSLQLPDGDIWIFGYGSLMWRPDFPYTDFQPALLRGYHRSLCIYSVEYRGTFECPGLVLGLDLGEHGMSAYPDFSTVSVTGVHRVTNYVRLGSRLG